MSWRTQVRALQAIGGRGTAVEIDPEMAFVDNPTRRLRRALALGLVSSTGTRGGRERGRAGAPMAIWTLTQLGADWAAGRVSELQVLRAYLRGYFKEKT